MGDATLVIEVFADVACPFAHVGLRRLADRRDELGRADVVLRVRSWPLEHVNAAPHDPDLVADEVAAIRQNAAPDLLGGFAVRTFPTTSLPALALAAAAYRSGDSVGEAVSLEVRDLLFEQGVDVSDPEVIARIAAAHGLTVTAADDASVEVDHAEGRARGVVGSPYFFTPSGPFFCPLLDVGHDDGGRLVVRRDDAQVAAFLQACTLA